MGRSGMPVRATSDGRLYKPLFAILCTDLDGRLNLNAHGSMAQADTTDYNLPGSKAGGVIAGNPAAANLARGLGFGPAEIKSYSPAGGLLYAVSQTGGARVEGLIKVATDRLSGPATRRPMRGT